MGIQANQLPRVTTVPATADVILIDPSTNEGSVANAGLIGGGGGSGPSPYTSAPAALGTASPGTSNKYARGDHVQPLPAVATTSAAGLMSAQDKGRLDDLYADYSSALAALG